MEVNEVDTLVVGAGPSGLAAAIQLKSLGVKNVWVVDREEIAGGVPWHCDHTGFGVGDLRRVMSGPAYAKHYVASAEKAGVRIHTGVTVTDWMGTNQVSVTSARGISAIKAGAIVLATGCRERPRAARLIPGTRPEGIFTTGSLQRYVHDFNHPVGKRALVVGAEHVSYSAVQTLRHFGISIAGMVTQYPGHQSFPLFVRIAKGLLSFPLFANCEVTNILGKPRLEAVEITDLSTGTTKLIACDTLVFTGDWIPDRELARKGGLALDAGTKGPAVDAARRSSIPGVFAIGNLVHPGETADTAALSGRAAARNIHEYLQRASWQSDDPIGFEFEPDLIAWISPNVLQPGQRYVPQGRFILRVSSLLHNRVLVIQQGERILWRRRYRRLVPNLPYRIPSSFMTGLDPNGGPVHITAAAS